jgi:hypothetical protein
LPAKFAVATAGPFAHPALPAKSAAAGVHAFSPPGMGSVGFARPLPALPAERGPASAHPPSPVSASASPLLRRIGGVVRIIYLDRAGAISERYVRVDGAAGGKIRAYCFLRRGPRTFEPDRILAFEPARRGWNRHG